MRRSIHTLAVAIVVSLACAGVAVAGSTPTVSTDAATKIADSSATLNGTINPQGSSTSYQFVYGLTTGYGSSTVIKSAGSGSKAVVKSAGISGLIPGTLYHFRLIATNKFGTAVGADRAFTTTGHPPAAVVTGPATGVGKTSATLTATVNPNGQTTGWTFQYGLTANYGNQVSGGVLAASTTPTTVTWLLQGLEPGVEFHYRILALHGLTVVSDGADQTFFTLPNPTPVPRVKARTTPRIARHAPYVLTTSGSIAGPASIPPALECVGTAAVRYFLGDDLVGFAVAAMQSNCTFSVTNTFRHLPGRSRHHRVRTATLRIVVRFRGNGYLAAANSRVEKVRLG
jgi:hypothetical protein